MQTRLRCLAFAITGAKHHFCELELVASRPTIRKSCDALCAGCLVLALASTRHRGHKASQTSINIDFPTCLKHVAAGSHRHLHRCPYFSGSYCSGRHIAQKVDKSMLMPVALCRCLPGAACSHSHWHRLPNCSLWPKPQS